MTCMSTFRLNCSETQFFLDFLSNVPFVFPFMLPQMGYAFEPFIAVRATKGSVVFVCYFMTLKPATSPEKFVA